MRNMVSFRSFKVLRDFRLLHVANYFPHRVIGWCPGVPVIVFLFWDDFYADVHLMPLQTIFHSYISTHRYHQ